MKETMNILEKITSVLCYIEKRKTNGLLCAQNNGKLENIRLRNIIWMF